MMQERSFEACFAELRSIPGEQNLYQTLGKVMEEAGELAEAINIQEGYVNKPKTSDGVLGEACDLIITAITIIHTVQPDIKEEDIMKLLRLKYHKWRLDAEQRTQDSQQ